VAVFCYAPASVNIFQNKKMVFEFEFKIETEFSQIQTHIKQKI